MAFDLAADVLAACQKEVLSGSPPIRYSVGSPPFDRIKLGPGLVSLFGGSPGAGKTALTMQLATDGLRLNDSLRVLVANVEMAPVVLLDRQLARLSGIALTTILERKVPSSLMNKYNIACATLRAVSDRLCFLKAPWELENLAEAADTFKADLLLLDYIQRFKPPGSHGNPKSSLDLTMNFLRQFADTGLAVVVVSAIARSKDKTGNSSYDPANLNIASFRESSELEFGADSAYMVVANAKRGPDAVTVKHLKERYGSTEDLQINFYRSHQAFEDAGADSAKGSHGGAETAARIWEKCSMAPSDGGNS